MEDESALDGDGGSVDLQEKVGSSERYEAESRSATQGCSETAGNPGFTGTGYMDFGGQGSFVEWNNIRAGVSGDYELNFRFANGTGGSRRALILVNGSNGGSLAFGPSGGWATWRNEALKLRLRQGNNTIRVQADPDSGPNLDHVVVTARDLCPSDPNKVEPGTCGCGVAEGTCGGGSAQCTTANEGSSATLTCSGGATISTIQFASYGTPTGSCQTGFMTSSCHASSSLQKVKDACLGKPSCSVSSTNAVFSDPCVGTGKRLAVSYSCGGGGSAPVSIAKVYLAQNHVLEPDNPLFKLVGNQEALIKVHVTATKPVAAPSVTATLSLAGRSMALSLRGPSTLPTSFASQLGAVQHKYEDSFTARIPRAWVRPGLSVVVTAGSTRRDLGVIRVGAPTKVIMTMVDVHYFQQTPGDYAAGWQGELEAKWPVSDLEVRRTSIVFPQLIIPPRDVARAAKIRSKEEYTAQTGLPFDGEQAAALQWSSALKAAAGTGGRVSLYYMNIYGAYAGGQAGGFAGVGNGKDLGILNHELGHALSLPHWCGVTTYPYRGNMYGIPADAADAPHVGPTWAFDLPSGKFLPPTVQAGAPTWFTPGQYKRDPMCGGGEGDQEKPLLMRHFSDYSVNQMRDYLEGHVVVWNEALRSYASWNAQSGDYTSVVANDGVRFPVTRNVPVISVMAGVSVADARANPSLAHLVYPPIGPYTTGLIDLFQPSVAADKARADAVFCPNDGCDFSLRVVQGGVTKTYMLPISLNPSANPMSRASFETRAINLPASAGQVTRAELLCTPDAEKAQPAANHPACPTNLASASWSL